MEVSNEILDEHIDKLLDVINSIKENRITVIVGANGTGKSLIRKQLNVRLIKNYDENRNMVRHISQQLRTELRSDMGALACIGMDSPTDPTSISSYDLINSVMNYDMESKKYYIVLDEAEIGMSEESILGLLNYLDSKVPSWLNNTLGVMIITHSGVIAEHFVKNYDCDFYSIGYNSVSQDFDAWKNRVIKPTDFEWLSEWSNRLFHRVNERSKSIKK